MNTRQNSGITGYGAQVFDASAVNTEGQARLYRPPLLSTRETEVLQLLADGYLTDGIANALNVKPVTISKHLASARRKLACRTRAEAVGKAVSLGLVTV